MDLDELIHKASDERVDIDFLRDGIAMLAQALMEVDVTNRIGAALGERNPDGRTTHRNGYRSRRWDTRAGTVDLAIPKLRQDSYFPDFLLEPRRRAERALAAVVMQAYVEGVSTRRMDDVARAMGIEGISKSQVSEICKELDPLVEAWRTHAAAGRWAVSVPVDRRACAEDSRGILDYQRLRLRAGRDRGQQRGTP